MYSVVLICTFLITNGAEYFFICKLAFYHCLVYEVSIHVFCPYFHWVVCPLLFSVIKKVVTFSGKLKE